jgi:hypothetical protein
MNNQQRILWVPLYMVARRYKQTIQQFTAPQVAGQATPKIDSIVARFSVEGRDYRQAAHYYRRALRHHRDNGEFGLILVHLLMRTSMECVRRKRYYSTAWCQKTAPVSQLVKFAERGRELWDIVRKIKAGKPAGEKAY